MSISDFVSLASTVGLALVGLAALGGLRQALRMVERQTHDAQATRTMRVVEGIQAYDGGHKQ